MVNFLEKLSDNFPKFTKKRSLTLPGNLPKMEPQLNSESIFWICWLNAPNLNKNFKNLIQNVKCHNLWNKSSLNPYGPLVSIWKYFQTPKPSCASTCYMQPFYNKIKCLPSKMSEEFTSQKYLRIFDPFGPLVCIWNNFKIPKLSCASTSYMQPFYNKIKSLPSKM